MEMRIANKNDIETIIELRKAQLLDQGMLPTVNIDDNMKQYFEEVFEKLVPAGRGRLVIQRRIDQVCCQLPSSDLRPANRSGRTRRMLRRRMRRNRVPLTTILVSPSEYVHG